MIGRAATSVNGSSTALPERLGRYRVRALAARGGFADVYRCRDVELAVDVAVKLWRPSSQGDYVGRRQFREEARLLASLDHPNIVRVLDYGTGDDAGPFMVMPWVPSQLVELIGEDCAASEAALLPPDRRPRALAVAEALRLLDQLMQAVAHLHARGIVHADLKPANVLLTALEHGSVRLIDFGIARSVAVDSPARGGSAAYAAPEQFDDAAQIDARTDVYALGAIAYRMLTGRTTEGYTPRPRVLVPALPPALDACVTAALAADPDRRPPDAERLRASLAEVQMETG